MAINHDLQNNFVGLYEWVSLPELKIFGQQAKIDTGATNSSLDATHIKLFEKNGQPWVSFKAHLGVPPTQEQYCEAPFVGFKSITSSNGQTQKRYVIRSLLQLGIFSLFADFTLTRRNNMTYRLLIGTNVLVEAGLLVNPALTYVQPKLLLT